MNKKGFTLVELLAVIAILGVLMLIVLPNALSSYRNSKKSIFLSDIQSIYKTAVNQAKADNIGSRKAITYCRKDGYECDGFEELDLSGSKSIDYIITVDGDFTVSYFVATDEVYQYSKASAITDVTEINENDVAYIPEITEAEKVNFDSSVSAAKGA